MIKQLISLFIGFIVIITLTLISINTVFSYLYFDFFGIHTATMDLLHGSITPEQLRKLNIIGYFLTSNEIKHLQDVTILIKNSRVALLIFVPISAILLFRYKDISTMIIVRCWIIIGAIIAIITATYSFLGGKVISTFLHNILFPQGNWMFESLSLIRKIYNHQIIEQGFILCIVFIILLLIMLTISYWNCRKCAFSLKSTACDDTT